MPIALPLTPAQLEQISQTFDTPFYIYDEKGIRENAQHLKKVFAKNFPGFQEFFAVKALPNPTILQIMQKEGFGLDCSSASELYIAQKTGFKGNQIMFTSNYTSTEDLKRAFDQEVIINLDDISLIDALCEARKMPELISFRLNPGIGKTDSKTRSNVLGGKEAKFGIPTQQIIKAYQKAKQKGATQFGIHMMTGSCILDQNYFCEVVKILLDTMGKIKKALKIDFQFFNIGGGFGIPYRPHEKALDIEKLSKNLKKIYDQKVNQHKLGKPRLFMENGRYLSGPFGWLISRCQVIKKTYATYYGLDACMANLMRPGMYGSYHHITIPLREGGKRRKAHVVGTICENNDWFAKNRNLPIAKVGDLFVIHDTGAHGHAMGFQYNGKLRSAELLLRENGKVELIREPEKIEDLFFNTKIPKDFAA